MDNWKVVQLGTHTAKWKQSHLFHSYGRTHFAVSKPGQIHLLLNCLYPVALFRSLPGRRQSGRHRYTVQQGCTVWPSPAAAAAAALINNSLTIVADTAERSFSAFKGLASSRSMLCTVISQIWSDISGFHELTTLNFNRRESICLLEDVTSLLLMTVFIWHQ